MCCCLGMAGPKSQSSSAGAAIVGSIEWRKLCLDLISFWLDLAHREDAEGRFHVCVSQAGMRLSV